MSLPLETWVGTEMFLRSVAWTPTKETDAPSSFTSKTRPSDTKVPSVALGVPWTSGSDPVVWDSRRATEVARDSELVVPEVSPWATKGSESPPPPGDFWIQHCQRRQVAD